MRVKIVLKGIKDADLLALADSPGFYLARAFVVAISAYVHGEDVVIQCPLPPTKSVSIAERAVYLTINDAETEAWLNALPERCMSTALKTALRNALSKPYLDALMMLSQNKKSTSRPPKPSVAPPLQPQPSIKNDKPDTQPNNIQKPEPQTMSESAYSSDDVDDLLDLVEII